MAYASGMPGKLHSVRNKDLRPRCRLSFKGPMQRANRSYAESMESKGLLCRKCFPNGKLPAQT